MQRTPIIIGIVVVALSWYAMMAVHEAGHCLGAAVTGATVEKVEIPIVGFSRTDVSGSGHPLIVIWGGPVFGVVLPIVLLVFLACVNHRVRQIMLYFVGFCLLANGAYIGVGAFIGAGDCHDMLKHGSPMWLLVGFGVFASIAGLFAWHRMGPVRGWFVRGTNLGN